MCSALVASEAGLSIRSMSDITDALGATFGFDGLILAQTDLATAFFDLKTGLAGELFQKFQNYKLRLCLIVPEPAGHGERFTELAREHSDHHLIRIVRSRADADAWFKGDC
jgi:hypothetical protein